MIPAGRGCSYPLQDLHGCRFQGVNRSDYLLERSGDRSPASQLSYRMSTSLSQVAFLRYTSTTRRASSCFVAIIFYVCDFEPFSFKLPFLHQLPDPVQQDISWDAWGSVLHLVPPCLPGTLRQRFVTISRSIRGVESPAPPGPFLITRTASNHSRAPRRCQQ